MKSKVISTFLAALFVSVASFAQTGPQQLVSWTSDVEAADEADVYRVVFTGKIAEGYAADLVIFDKEKEFTVKAEDQHTKCGWSPYEGETLKGVIETVLVDGESVL